MFAKKYFSMAYFLLQRILPKCNIYACLFPPQPLNLSLHVHLTVIPLGKLLPQSIPLATQFHQLLVILLCIPAHRTKCQMFDHRCLHLCRNCSWQGTRQIPHCSSLNLEVILLSLNLVRGKVHKKIRKNMKNCFRYVGLS